MKRIDIMNFKRRMNGIYGCKPDWPPFVRARYDAMKEEADELAAVFGEVAA